MQRDTVTTRVLFLQTVWSELNDKVHFVLRSTVKNRASTATWKKTAACSTRGETGNIPYYEKEVFQGSLGDI